MPSLRILLADDEPLARDRLRAMLAGLPGFDLAGETASGAETLEAVARERPDILLLDIQMPGLDGLAVAARLPLTSRPAVVFASAHPEHGVAAFAAEAADYLLKPFDRERLVAALVRATNQLARRRTGGLEDRLRQVLAPSPRGDERLAIRCDGRVVFVHPDEIVWIEAASNYSTLHLRDNRRLMLRESLGSLEERLGPERFARVNRSAIARIEEVRELQATGTGDYTVLLRNGASLSLSRQLRGRIERFVPGGL